MPARIDGAASSVAFARLVVALFVVAVSSCTAHGIPPKARLTEIVAVGVGPNYEAAARDARAKAGIRMARLGHVNGTLVLKDSKASYLKDGPHRTVVQVKVTQVYVVVRK